MTAKHETEAAIDECNKAIKTFPGDWRAINNRGTAYFLTGQFADYADDYRRALQLNPESDIIKYNIDLIEDKLPPES